MFLDGITKSLGGSNVRNCHLIASEDVVKFIVAPRLAYGHAHFLFAGRGNGRL